MNGTITQIGVGGIFVLLLLQILLPWLLKVTARNGKQLSNLKSGEMDPAYWHKVFTDITSTVMERGMIQLLKPSLDAQTDVLRSIQESNRGIRDDVRQLVKALETWERRGDR